MVGFILHHHPAVIALRRLVLSGELGRLESIRAVRGASRMPTPEHPIWWSLAPHDASLALSLIGDQPRAITVRKSRSGKHESLHAWLEFADPVQVGIAVTSERSRRQLVVKGSIAEAVFDDLAPQQNKLTVRKPTTAAAVPLALDVAEPLATEFEHFVARLEDGSPFEPELDHAIDVVAMLEAGRAIVRAKWGDTSYSRMAEPVGTRRSSLRLRLIRRLVASVILVVVVVILAVAQAGGIQRIEHATDNRGTYVAQASQRLAGGISRRLHRTEDEHDAFDLRAQDARV